MKIAKTKMNRIAKFCNNVSSASKTDHGKVLEMFLSWVYKLPKYEQYKAKIDFPKEIITQGNVPSEWVADWEVKYYNIKTGQILLGDVVRKLECLQKGMVLVLGFYDQTPENLIDVVFIKLDSNKTKLTKKVINVFKEASNFVKNRENSIEETKEYVKQINAQINSSFYLSNTSMPPRFSNSKNRMLPEARAVSLSISTKKLLSLYL